MPPTKLQATEAPGNGGLLPEVQGRRFYDMFQMHAALACEHINRLHAETATAPTFANHQLRPITWDHTAMEANSVAARLRISHHFLKHHAAIMTMARERSPARRLLLSEALHRPVKRADVDEMQAWSIHVNDDFFVVGYVPQGAVFVQLLEGGGERVFVVKGIATRISELLAGGAQEVDGMRYVHTVLVPWHGAITYSAVVLEGEAHTGGVRRPLTPRPGGVRPCLGRWRRPLHADGRVAGPPRRHGGQQAPQPHAVPGVACGRP